MAELKTRPTGNSVEDFIAQLSSPTRRQDAMELLPLFSELAGRPPILWGETIIGFGSYRYRQRSGQEGEWPLTGFSPRKQNLVIYLMLGCSRYQSFLERLGKHKTGVSCLYLNKLADIDREILRQLLEKSIADMRQSYPCS